MGKAHVERRQGERPVGDDLDRRAAVAEQDHRAELGIVRCADDQLVRVRPADHRLHHKAVDPGLGRCLGDARAHRLDRRADLDSVRKIEGDAADIGLVRNVAGEDLDRDRKPDRIGGGHRLFGIGYGARMRHRDPIGSKDTFASGSVSQPLSSASAPSITACAAAVSGANSSGTEGGVSISARWLAR